MKKKQIAIGVGIAVAMLVGAAATSHAAAGEGADHIANCIACGLCEMLSAFLG